MNNNHVTTALEFAEAAEAMFGHLDDLPEDEANTYAARRMRNEVSTAVRLAHVHATLAVAEAIERHRQSNVFNATYTSGGQS